MAPIPDEIKIDEKVMQEYQKQLQSIGNIPLPEDDDDI